VPSLPVLYLASQSPRRAALINLLGVQRIEIRPSSVEEIFDYTESPEAIVQDLALQKAEASFRSLAKNDPHGIVLGADTIVVLGEKILGKPLDEVEAARMLRSLSNNTHTVFTGVALIDTKAKSTHTFFEKTDVTFRPLSAEEIGAYIATGSPMDKAGAYGIQEDHGAVFVKKISGDYYNVVGLPLCSLHQHLKSIGPELFL
jgi:septum formation protein